MKTGGIFCIENDWYPEEVISDERWTIRHLLYHVCMINEVPFARYDCGTEQELEHRLKYSRKRGYAVLYLGFHGRKGKIVSERGFIGPDRLAKMMGGRYRGWAVHFGSCLTLRDHDQLRAFKRAVGARVVSGYSIYSKWDRDYSAIEIAWLSQLVSGHRTLPAMYKRLTRKTGLVVL